MFLHFDEAERSLSLWSLYLDLSSAVFLEDAELREGEIKDFSELQLAIEILGVESLSHACRSGDMYAIPSVEDAAGGWQKRSSCRISPTYAGLNVGAGWP